MTISRPSTDLDFQLGGDAIATTLTPDVGAALSTYQVEDLGFYLPSRRARLIGTDLTPTNAARRSCYDFTGYPRGVWIESLQLGAASAGNARILTSPTAFFATNDITSGLEFSATFVPDEIAAQKARTIGTWRSEAGWVGSGLFLLQSGTSSNLALLAGHYQLTPGESFPSPIWLAPGTYLSVVADLINQALVVKYAISLPPIGDF